jgi:hypothetical protein
MYIRLPPRRGSPLSTTLSLSVSPQTMPETEAVPVGGGVTVPLRLRTIGVPFTYGSLLNGFCGTLSSRQIWWNWLDGMKR